MQYFDATLKKFVKNMAEILWTQSFTGNHYAKIHCSDIFTPVYDVAPELSSTQNNVAIHTDNLTTILWHDAELSKK